MRLSTLLRFVVFAVVGFTAARAVETASPRPMKAEDVWSVRRPGALDLSRDGTRLVFTVTDYNLEKNNATTHLWLLEAATGAMHQLTTAGERESDPRWSPDGTRIAFVAKRGADEQPSLYVIPAAGGEAEKIVELPMAISSPRWLPDGQRIVFVTTVLPKFASDPDKMKAELKKEKESKVTAKVTENAVFRYFDTWETDDHAQRLYLVDLATKKTTDLTPHWDRRFRFDNEAQFDLSPDGHAIALSAGTTPPPYRNLEENPDIYLISVDDSAAPWKNLTADNPGADENPRFTPDGKAVLFGRTRRLHGAAEFTKLCRVDLASGKITRLLAGVDLSPQDWQMSHDGRTLFFRAEDHGRTKIFSAAPDGTAVKAIVADATNSALTVGPSQLFFLTQSFNRPDEIRSYDLATGAVAVRSHLNDALFAGLDLGRVEEYTFTGAGGDTVQGWLIYPPKFDPKKKYALLQLMHGGPATMIGDIWQARWNAHVFVAPGPDAPDGYIATWVNRHGSTGFGEKFVASIDGAWGERPFEDIMRATDYLLAKHPFLDANRTAALGASYGGYMACWVCGHTDRFKAIVCHAGVSDFDTQYASDVAPLWQETPMAGSPWNRTPAYEAQNPMNFAKNFHTPTLVTHGGSDYRVPDAQGLEFYVALQSQGVPSRLVYFPDENHWILHAQNSVYWYGEVRAWLARWIK